jgi:hypothetical protein
MASSLLWLSASFPYSQRNHKQKGKGKKESDKNIQKEECKFLKEE